MTTWEWGDWLFTPLGGRLYVSASPEPYAIIPVIHPYYLLHTHWRENQGLGLKPRSSCWHILRNAKYLLDVWLTYNCPLRNSRWTRDRKQREHTFRTMRRACPMVSNKGWRMKHGMNLQEVLLLKDSEQDCPRISICNVYTWSMTTVRRCSR